MDFRSFLRPFIGALFTASSRALFLVIFFAPIYSWADGEVKSEFFFQLDNSIFTAPEFEFLPHLKGEEKLVLPDTSVTVEGDVPVHIRGIEAAVSYRLNAGSKQIHLGAEHMVASDALEARISIREISVNTVVERIVNGIKLRVRIQASCQNVQLQMNQDQARILGVIRTGVDEAGLPSIEVPWFEVSWSPSAWKAEEFSCSGIQGFKNKVTESLKDYLKDPTVFSAEFRKTVDERITQYQKDVRDWFLSPKPIEIDLADVKVSMHPKEIVNVRGGLFQVHGDLRFVFAGNPSDSQSRYVEVKGLDKTAPVPGFALLVPEGLVQALSDMAYSTGRYVERKRGEEIPAYRALRKDRLTETYVWPEFQLFDPKAEFFFDFQAKTAPKFSAVTSDVSGVPHSTIQSDVEVQSWAPRSVGSGHEKFVKFNTPISAAFKFLIRQMSGAEHPELRVEFSSFDMQLSYIWDSEYAKRRRFEKIDKALMQKELTNSMIRDGVSFQLSPLSLSSVHKLSPVAIKKSDSWLQIDWK